MGNKKKYWAKKGFAFCLAVCLSFCNAAPVSALKDYVGSSGLGGEAQIKPSSDYSSSFSYVTAEEGSKKGLQFGESLDDAINLGVKYCLFNIEITELMETSGNILEYIYNGKSYSFNLDAFERWGSLFSQLQDAGINLSVEFLLPWVEGQTDLIYPAARSYSAVHNYYAWNISTQEDKDRYAALFSCIAQMFDGTNGMGHINNYLIGNEVNAYDQWHYTGSTSLQKNAELYADTFQVVYSAVMGKSEDTRVCICLEHSWNTGTAGRVHAGKDFLDTFADRLEEYGSPNFTIGYHAYSEPLTDAAFWNNSATRVKDSVNSPYITMKNIEQLTKYVKSKYGTKTRIMLTEQGFSSHGENGQMKQAAAIAYAFYKAQFNDMIDCIIFRCQADTSGEIANDGLYMGLWTLGMGEPKVSHDVFQYMDTAECESYTAACRQYLGIDQWSEVVPGYQTGYFE